MLHVNMSTEDSETIWSIWTEVFRERGVVSAVHVHAHSDAVWDYPHCACVPCLRDAFCFSWSFFSSEREAKPSI